MRKWLRSNPSKVFTNDNFLAAETTNIPVAKKQTYLKPKTDADASLFDERESKDASTVDDHPENKHKKIDTQSQCSWMLHF